MQRRKFIMALGGAVASAPFAARAQQATGRLYKIGYLGPASRELHLTKAFEDGLRSLGYRIGENVVIEYRFANGEMERLPANAADVVPPLSSTRFSRVRTLPTCRSNNRPGSSW